MYYSDELLNSSNYIKLPKTWFYNSNKTYEPYCCKLNNIHLMIICYLLRFLSTRKKIIFDISWVCDYFKLRKDKVFKLLAEIKVSNLLEIYSDIKTKAIIVELSKDFTSEYHDCFNIVYDFELDILINKDKKIDYIANSFALLLYIKNQTRWDGNWRAGYISNKFIGENINVLTNKSIKDYNDFLLETGLVLYNNPGLRLFSNGTTRQSPNFYILNVKDAKNVLDSCVQQYKSEELSKDHIFISDSSHSDGRVEYMKNRWGKDIEQNNNDVNIKQEDIEVKENIQKENNIHMCEYCGEYEAMIDSNMCYKCKELGF